MWMWRGRIGGTEWLFSKVWLQETKGEGESFEGELWKKK
jgi:hypothetical protein